MLAERVAALAPMRGRVVVFLEGGYDLDALRDSTTATVRALLGVGTAPGESPTGGGPGATVVDAALERWAASGRV